MSYFLDHPRHAKYITDIFCHTVEVAMGAEHFSPSGVRQWLIDNFGQEYEGWVLRGPAIYGFRTERDKLLFTLRWT